MLKVVTQLCLVLGALVLSVRSQASEDLVRLGCWTNIRVSSSVDPHAQGYKLRLWSHEGKIVGLLAKFVGPASDPPMGWIENGSFEPATQEIEFESTLSTGKHYSDETQNWEWAISRFVFSGRVHEDMLKGVFTAHASDEPEQITSREQVTLMRDPVGCSTPEKRTFKEWSEYFAPLIEAQRQGPSGSDH